jgi:4a-hydroxytetrahydrobiopterin dehydratase
MPERISPKRFHESDWRVIRDAACAHFRTGSLAQGVALATAVARVAEEVELRPEVDLRSSGVTVRIPGYRGEVFSEADVTLAERISSAAKDLGASSDPSAVQTVQVAIDALVIPEVLPFWRAVLGYDQIDDEDLVDPRSDGPPFWFQQMDAPRPQRNRIHIDVYVPHDQAEARVAAALAAGGHLVSDAYAPEWWTLADAEGNEVDVAPWPDQERA